MSYSSIIEIVGFVLGVIYLFYEYKANARVWVVSLMMTLVSMQVYYTRGLYADFAMNIYYLVMAIYGYIVWTRRHQHEGESRPALKVRHINRRTLAGCIAAFVPVYAAIALWLVLFTDSNVPYADAFTTAVSIIATWMLARKYVEQWLAWILVDGVCVGLYIYKEIYLYATLYAAYTGIAWLGYRKWQRMTHVIE